MPHLREKFEQLSQQFSQFVFANCDAFRERELFVKYNFKHIYEILVYKKGKLFRVLDMSKDEQVPVLAVKLNKYLQQPYKLASMQEAVQRAEPNKALILVHVQNETTSQLFATIGKLFEVPNDCDFAYMLVNNEKEKLVLVKQHMGEDNIEWNESEMNLIKFLQLHYFALVEKPTYEAVHRVTSDVKNVIAMCYNCTWDRKVAMQAKKELQWYMFECESNCSNVHVLQGLKGFESFSGIAAHTGDNRYLYDGTQQDVLEWMHKVRNGQVTPAHASAPLPAQEYENGIRVVVGSTFDKLVIQEPKTVLVAYYAPWSGHCKHALLILEKVVDKVANHAVIAKIDATQNETPNVDLRGYPSIYVFWQGNKTHPVSYEGNRTVEAFVEYLMPRSNVETSRNVRDEL